MSAEVTWKDWDSENRKHIIHTGFVGMVFRADQLNPSHAGMRFRSHTYNSKNKTARLSPDKRVWELSDLYFHKNGNIVVNNGHYYLKADTEVELVIPYGRIND